MDVKPPYLDDILLEQVGITDRMKKHTVQKLPKCENVSLHNEYN